jgi:cbb3-type cytochrome oxidase subunit 3
MAWLILEALLALLVFIGIIYWTMFSGRKRGELDLSDDNRDSQH